MSSKAEQIREQIAALERELDAIERVIVDVHPGDHFSPSHELKQINLHMEPITRIDFGLKFIRFWGGALFFSMDIQNFEPQHEVTVRVVK